MARSGRRRGSRSLAANAWLLHLYPLELQHRHRPEMLQNFADLAQASASPFALWMLMGASA
jgi:N-acetyl-gamma-glutamylphosphate reductase